MRGGRFLILWDAALNPIGLKLLDHIVVGENSVFSFADNGIMDEIALAGAS